MNRTLKRAAIALGILGMLASPFAASAQTPLAASEAQEFLGSWIVALQTDMGPFNVTLDIAEADGQVVAQVGSPQGTVPASTITRSGESLVLGYSMDAQGQEVPVSVNLRRDGEALRANLDFAGGMFTATGTGTRAP